MEITKINLDILKENPRMWEDIKDELISEV